jgi:hypothetical protein
LNYLQIALQEQFRLSYCSSGLLGLPKRPAFQQKTQKTRWQAVQE